MRGIDLGNLGNDRRLSASCHGIAHNYSYHWGHPGPNSGPRVHQLQVVGDTVSKGPLKGSALKPIQKWGDQVVARKLKITFHFLERKVVLKHRSYFYLTLVLHGIKTHFY